jgi:AraC-like DNA-binding protein
MIEIERRQQGKITQNDSGYSANIGEVKQFIDTHLYGNISPYFVSDHFGYLHNTLTKKFKKEVGCSIQHYIILKRIEASKKNLETSSDSISKIATMVGFDNPSYFSLMFRKIVGCSPNEYRKNTKR